MAKVFNLSTIISTATARQYILLPPLKCHSFSIDTPTNFVFLKFTESFFKNIDHVTIGRNGWFKEASYILSNYNQLPGDIIKNDLDSRHLEV
jgi:hypothetical protein